MPFAERDREFYWNDYRTSEQPTTSAEAYCPGDDRVCGCDETWSEEVKAAAAHTPSASLRACASRAAPTARAPCGNAENPPRLLLVLAHHGRRPCLAVRSGRRARATAPSSRCSPQTSPLGSSAAWPWRAPTSPCQAARCSRGPSHLCHCVPRLRRRRLETHPSASCRGQVVSWRGPGGAPATSQAAPHSQQSERGRKGSERAFRGALPAPPSPPRRRTRPLLAARVAALVAVARRLAERRALQGAVGFDVALLSARRLASAASRHHPWTEPRPAWAARVWQLAAARPSCQDTPPRHAA